MEKQCHEKKLDKRQSPEEQWNYTASAQQVQSKGLATLTYPKVNHICRAFALYLCRSGVILLPSSSLSSFFYHTIFPFFCPLCETWRIIRRRKCCCCCQKIFLMTLFNSSAAQMRVCPFLYPANVAKSHGKRSSWENFSNNGSLTLTTG